MLVYYLSSKRWTPFVRRELATRLDPTIDYIVDDGLVILFGSAKPYAVNVHNLLKFYKIKYEFNDVSNFTQVKW